MELNAYANDIMMYIIRYEKNKESIGVYCIRISGTANEKQHHSFMLQVISKKMFSFLCRRQQENSRDEYTCSNRSDGNE